MWAALVFGAKRIAQALDLGWDSLPGSGWAGATASLRRTGGRRRGKRMTSRMEREPVRSMVRRSMPMPSPPVGGQAVAEGADVVFVHGVGFVVAAGFLFELGFEAEALLDGVVEFGEGVADFEAADVELEALDPVGLVGLLLGEGRYGEGEVVDDGGLDEVGFGYRLRRLSDAFCGGHGVSRRRSSLCQRSSLRSSRQSAPQASLGLRSSDPCTESGSGTRVSS